MPKKSIYTCINIKANIKLTSKLSELCLLFLPVCPLSSPFEAPADKIPAKLLPHFTSVTPPLCEEALATCEAAMTMMSLVGVWAEFGDMFRVCSVGADDEQSGKIELNVAAQWNYIQPIRRFRQKCFNMPTLGIYPLWESWLRC